MEQARTSKEAQRAQKHDDAETMLYHFSLLGKFSCYRTNDYMLRNGRCEVKGEIVTYRNGTLHDKEQNLARQGTEPCMLRNRTLHGKERIIAG